MIKSFGYACGAAAGIVLGLGTPSVRAQDASGGAPVNCISLMRIDHTQVVDDKTILFFMKDRRVYKNAMQNACPGLRENKPFMYRVMLNQLCNVDTVTVLEDWGFGYAPGATCLLEKFEPISDEEAAELIANADEKK